MPPVRINVDDVLRFGMDVVGFSSNNGSMSFRRFKLTYGVLPITAFQVYNDIQNEELVGGFVVSKPKLSFLLMTLRWMKSYAKEVKIAGIFGCSEKTARGRIWTYLAAISALNEVKIVWPFDNIAEIQHEFLISVDGTHCRINEPRTEPNSNWYSHKFHKAALDYEPDVHLYESKLVWTNGPFPAGCHDLTIYRQALKDKIPATKKVIADNGYQSKEEINLSTPNPFDTDEVKFFKNRARARHETINKKIKTFEVLSGVFRHDHTKHKSVFEAVCVLVQYDTEDGHKLFDI